MRLVKNNIPPRTIFSWGSNLATAGSLALVLLAVMLGGCGGGTPNMVVESSYHAFTPEEMEARGRADGGRYRIQPGDVIELDFKYEDDLDKANILILPDGRFTAAGIDNINAAGLTVSELDELLVQRLSSDYRNPEVSVIIQEMGDRFVYVFGEVNKPGSYALDQGRGGILQSIALAGGFTNDASTAEVLIIRVAEDGYFYKIADISHLEKKAPFGLAELQVQGNDIIFVPRSTLGDLKYFGETFLANALRVTDIFWDIYAMNHLDKVDRLVR